MQLRMHQRQVLPAFLLHSGTWPVPCLLKYQHVAAEFRYAGIAGLLSLLTRAAARIVGVIPAHAHS